MGSDHATASIPLQNHKHLPEYKYSQISPLPELRYTGSSKKATSSVRALEGKVIGLDVEYVTKTVIADNGERKCWNKPALLQLFDGKLILLIQLNNGMSTLLPEAIVQLICDPGFIKVGVGTLNDSINLVRAYPNQFFRGHHVCKKPAGILELSDLAHIVDPVGCPNSGICSLAGLCELYEGKKLNKSPNGHKGSWQSNLTEKQKDYAANDVTCSWKIYQELSNRAESLGRQMNTGNLCRPIDVAAICRSKDKHI